MRPFLLALIGAITLIGLVNLVGSLTNPHDGGTFGFSVGSYTPHNNTTVTVDTVQPHSPASEAGLHKGDELSYAPTFANRIRLFAPAPGDSVAMTRAGERITITAVTDETPAPLALVIVATVSKLAFLFMGVLVAWRKQRDPAALALGLFLVCFGAAIDYDLVLFPALIARFLSFVFVQCAFVTGGISVLAFACAFPQRATDGIRRFLSRLVVLCAVAGFGATIGAFLSGFAFANRQAGSLFSTIYILNYLLILGATLTALVASYREAVREQRARMRWVLGTFIVGFSGLAVLFGMLAFSVHTQWGQYASLTVLAIPFGLGYVILRHRVIDIGFVVNRAVVYTGVSIVVVGAFIMFEWVLAHVVEANTSASTIIQLGGALALGLSVRFIHARVDRYVDDLFFRERHLAEAAIRRFAHETGLITDPDILVKRTVDVAERNARVIGAAFYARLASKYVPLHSTFATTPGELDENDETILDMRTWHNAIDVATESHVPGYIVFPMIVRGQLSGFLACGEKTTHEAFAPDERDALRVLARDAGVALDSLRISRIERELAYLSADGELPGELRLRLSSLLHPEDGAQPAGAAPRSIQ